MSAVDDLRPIFQPKTIAVIGASRSHLKMGHETLLNTLVGGFKGKVYPVNPEVTEIMGLRTYPSVLSIDEEVDLALIVVPAKLVPKVMMECAKKGVKGAIVISAGFSEVGEEGRKLEENVISIAKAAGIRVVGPNTMGYKSPVDNIDASFVFGMANPGRVALISQSGALCIGMIHYANAEKIGLSRIISVGNKADVDDADLIEYLEQDDKSDVIAMYIEGIRDGRKFLKTAKKAKKPIVAIKAGRTEGGAAAAMTHTGSLSGYDQIYNSAFKQARIQRAYDVEELFDCARALAYQPPARNKRVGIVTNGGGAGIMLTDWVEDFKLKVPPLKEKTKEDLLKILPEISVPRNPVDVIGDAGFYRYWAAGNALLNDPNIDMLIMTCVHGGYARPREYAGAVLKLTREKRSLRKPIISCWVGGVEIEEVVEDLKTNNIPVYPSVRRAARAAKALYDEGRRVGITKSKH
ncbi:MAG TPA: acetyl-CoA synthetase [Euryarchaeota archaeon]|nr:acetyl-CoA synthetase [Euryarchaeota archaeon]